MATRVSAEISSPKSSANSAPVRYVFFFGNGKAEGNKDMKPELGGKKRTKA